MSENPLPCPFCGREIKIDRNDLLRVTCFLCDGCGACVSFRGETEPKLKTDRIASWNRRAPDPDPDPKSLTPDELRERIGLPVYIVDEDYASNTGWTIWRKGHIEYWLDMPENGENCGTIWRAYDRPPREGVR